MEEDLCEIRHVGGPFPVKNGCEEYLIDAVKLSNKTLLQVQTINQWKAGLCQRAFAIGKPIMLGHEKTAYGPTLKAAYFLTASLDEAAS